VNSIISADRRLAVVCIVFFALGVNAAPPQTEQDAPQGHAPGRRITVIGLSNFGEVTPKLYRGGQPKGTGYEHLKEMGVDIVVDLRLSGRDAEKRNVTKAGMQFVALPWHCLFPKDRVFAEFLKLLQENPDKKVFVHCRYGDDRTGMMIAAYRMAVQGWTPEEARREMQKFGFHRLVCPSLVPYEKNFPKHLKNSPDSQALRSEVGSSSR
jgi:tyrosine-protein phosphatase SIW14